MILASYLTGFPVGYVVGRFSSSVIKFRFYIQRGSLWLVFKVFVVGFCGCGGLGVFWFSWPY